MEVEITPGIEEHKWKSPDIDKFINKSQKTVEELYETVVKMKDSLTHIQTDLAAFNK